MQRWLIVETQTLHFSFIAIKTSRSQKKIFFKSTWKSEQKSISFYDYFR